MSRWGVIRRATVVCANCFAALDTPFCGACGTPRLDDRPLTMRRLADDAWHELTSLDSATLRTMRSLARRPGELTRAYLDGRTRWLLPPLRVFFLAFGVFLIGQSLLPNDVERALRAQEREMGSRGSPGVGKPAGAPVATGTASAPSELPHRITSAVLDGSRNPWWQMLVVVPWALVLSALYRKRRRNFAEHALMAIHLLSANVLVSLLNSMLHAAVGKPVGKFDAISVVHWLAIGSYFYPAARRVHEESPRVTAGKSVLFVAGAQLSMFVVPLVALSVMLLQFAAEMLLTGR